VISSKRLHVFEVLGFFDARLSILNNTCSHVGIPTRHTRNIVRIVALINRCIWMIITLESVIMSPCRHCVGINTDHASVIIILAGMMMIIKVFVLILNNDLLKNLMRIILISLRLMSLLSNLFLGHCFSCLRELALHLRVAHSDTIKIYTIRVLVLECS